MLPASSFACGARRLWPLGLALLLALSLPSALANGRRSGPPAAKPTPSITALAFSSRQSKIVLQGPYSEAYPLVETRDSTGRVKDVTDQVAWSLSDPSVAAMEEGALRPKKDGSATLIARLKDRTARIPVQVTGLAQAAPPRFITDVLPVLAKAGCNQGACHGAGSGKGGFKLSLRGYDPDWDYEAITRMAGGRRVTPAQPENSLLLRKPTFTVSHRGGQIFKVGSPEYRLLRDWIAKGLPAPSEKEPKVTRLEITPPVRTVAVGDVQRFQVRARYSDGTVRDVTGQTLFSASDGAVAAVAPNGEAKVVGQGEAAVLVRYQSLVATARLVSPYGPPRPLPTSTQGPSAQSGEAQIDRLVSQKLAALGLETSPLCSDSDFLRRATLDVIGLLPTPEEAKAFLADRDPQKRAKLIDALLERPEYVDFWTLKWGDILRCSRQLLTDRGMYALNSWIRRSVAENKPWNQFARELLLAQGSAFADGPANFFRAASSPETLAETTSQVFLGVRIQCAKCHNHPYEKWTQNQYYQMAAFFARIKAKDGETPGERVIYTSAEGEEMHPKTHKAVVPTALDAAPVPASFTGDRREALAEWLTSPQNPFFARILVNRLWRHFMGQGIVEPVDDLRVTNPPSNPALLDWLAADFTRHGYDLKYLMRAILRSQTYQRAAEPKGNNAPDTRFYSHYAFKRLGAEQLLDALASATGVSEKFAGYPSGIRAAALPDTDVPSYFLDLFGRPARKVTCECERIDAPSLGQVLHFMNGKDIADRLTSKTGRVAQLLAAKRTDAEIVEELYLATLSRFPTAAEKRSALKVFTPGADRQKAGEDLLWALLNSKEFLFNH
jgi:mono/diheme cytochrome c family protein